MSFRATCAEIDLSAIAHNLQEIKKKVAPAEIMAVLKADAYGHGLKEVARVALENDARCFTLFFCSVLGHQKFVYKRI